jgi:hypothetical protein
MTLHRKLGTTDNAPPRQDFNETHMPTNLPSQPQLMSLHEEMDKRAPKSSLQTTNHRCKYTLIHYQN